MPTVCELKIAAKAKGLRGYSNMNKARLMELLAPAKPKPTPLSASGSARRVKKAPAKKEPVKKASLSSADFLAQKLLKEEKGDLQTGVHTYNQLHYTWKEGDELNDYGLTMAVPSASILKIFYTDWFKKGKDDTYFYYIHEDLKDQRYASFRQHMEEEREKERKKK